jgi:hypothetical protein
MLDGREQLAGEERVVRMEAAAQGLPQLRELLAQLTVGEHGQHGRIAGILDEPGAHRTPGDAEPPETTELS